MLKSEVCVNGLVTRAAVAKTNAEGNSFVTFGLKVDVPSKQGVSNVLDISVSRDGADTAGMTTNARVEVKGTLSFKKRGEKMYLNLHADEVNLSPASTTDMLTGTLSFRGTIGKNVETKNDKNGKPYVGICHHLIPDLLDYRPANLLCWLTREEHSEADRRQRLIKKAVGIEGMREIGYTQLRFYQDPRETSAAEFEEWLNLFREGQL